MKAAFVILSSRERGEAEGAVVDACAVDVGRGTRVGASPDFFTFKIMS